MKKSIIIEEINGELAVTILLTGYNIVEKIIYEPKLAQTILDKIEEAL